MPSLDLSDAFDPTFLDTFLIIRRKEAINNKGRNVITTLRFNGIGVVDAASPNDLERLPDYQYQGGAISIVTKIRLFEEANQVENGIHQGYQPDLIEWAGSHYIVKTMENYSRFGIGWVQAICIETTYVGTASQDGEVTSTFNFQVPQNSGNLSCC